MTTNELKALLLTIDPKLTKYVGDGTSQSYTVWTPHNGRSEWTEDGVEDRTVMVTIDRYSKSGNDTLAETIYTTLVAAGVSADEPIVVRPDLDEALYYRWIIECVVTR